MVKAKKVSAGDFHLIGISLDDTLIGWGSNDDMQLSFPPNIIKVKDVVAGQYTSFAIKNDGTVIGFGGDGTQMISGIPSDLKAKKVGVTLYQAAAIREDGSFAIWGKENPEVEIQFKDVVPADLKAKDFSITDGHALFILEDDTVVAFGNNEGGQLDVPAGLKAKKVVAQPYMSFAIDMEDKIRFWGETAHGTFTPPSIPVLDMDASGDMLVIIEEQSRKVAMIDFYSEDLSIIKLKTDTPAETVEIGTRDSLWITLPNGQIEGFSAFFETEDPDVYLHGEEYDDEQEDQPLKSFGLPPLREPLEMSPDKIIAATIPVETYDPLMASDVPTADYISEDKGNAVFIIGNNASGYPKNQLSKDYIDGTAISYECNAQMGLMVKPDNVKIDEPYYKLKLAQGSFMIPMNDFMDVLESNHQVFKLTELKTLPFTAGRAAVSTNGERNIDGEPLNLVGMDHCSVGTDKKTYSLTPVKPESVGGKVNRKTKKVRFNKRKG